MHRRTLLALGGLGVGGLFTRSLASVSSGVPGTSVLQTEARLSPLVVEATMPSPSEFMSEPVTFSIDKDQGQTLVVCGSPLKEPSTGTLWLVHNHGPEAIQLFDDHGKTETLPPDTEIFFPQAGEVNLTAKLNGERLTTGTIRLVKTQQHKDGPLVDVFLRGHDSTSCVSLAGLEGRGHWAITYLAGTLPLDIYASHPTGPGGDDGRENFMHALTPNHDGRPRTVIVFKPVGKELSIHIDTEKAGFGGEKGPRNYVQNRSFALLHDVY